MRGPFPLAPFAVRRSYACLRGRPALQSSNHRTLTLGRTTLIFFSLILWERQGNPPKIIKGRQPTQQKDIHPQIKRVCTNSSRKLFLFVSAYFTGRRGGQFAQTVLPLLFLQTVIFLFGGWLFGVLGKANTSTPTR